MKLINSKRQPANLKILPTKEEFSNEEVGVKKCQDSRCECFELLLLSKEHALKNINKTFRLEILTYCNSLNAIYVVLCSGCLEEYIGELLQHNIKNITAHKATRASTIKS